MGRFDHEKVIISFVIIYAFSITLLLNFRTTEEQQFVYLADSFLHKQLAFRMMPGSWRDTVPFEGRYYWPLGPFPAVVLVPFVALFGISFKQGYVSLPLTILNFFLIAFISRKAVRMDRNDAFWMAFVSLFVSVYLGAALVSWSWYFAHVVATTLILLAIAEYYNKQRYWVIGLVYSFLVATRISAATTLVFFLGEIFLKCDSPFKKRALQVASLLFPVIIVGAILGWYNIARFSDPFETGYRMQLTAQENLAARDYFGLYSIRAIPTNFYYYFLKGPDPILLKPGSHILTPPYVAASPLGISFFFISPIFLFIFFAPWSERVVRSSWITIAMGLLLLLSYYPTGFRTFGPRYILDVFPFFILLLIYSRHRSLRSRGVKLFSYSWFGLDLYLFTTIFR